MVGHQVLSKGKPFASKPGGFIYAGLRHFSLILLCTALSGCLQVELYGPVAGSSVTITQLRGQRVVEEFKTDSRQASLAKWTPQKWASFAPAVQLWLLGGADVPAANLDDNTLYLVSASGGWDHDHDENRVPDNFGALVFGEWHAVATGAQLKQPVMRVSILTEALYQTLLPDLDELSNNEVIARLDELAQLVVEDINKDGGVDYSDVLAWSTMLNEAQYKGPGLFLERVRYDIEYALAADIIADDATNAVIKANWKPAISEGRYSDTLVSCATPVLIRDLCELQTLPLLATESAAPTVEDVMQRVVVSHEWMAMRFEQFLRAMPDTVLQLSRSLTGVIIGAEVRPSYYSSVNSMMYLDADNFWLTEAERMTISTEEDYRAEFARQFEFADLWRYVRDSKSAFKGHDDVDENGNRTLEQALEPAAALLFHELAHANDQVPSNVYHTVNPALSLYDQTWVRPSDELSGELPLQSSQLLSLAAALYHGSDPTSTEKAYSGDTVGLLFDPDGASDLYAYSSQFEDLAMLFEEFMMRRHFGLERDIGFSNNPDDEIEEPECEDFSVRWGVRGRIGAPQLRPRLARVMADLLPGENVSIELSQLPVPTAMEAGKSWCENLVLGGTEDAGRPPAAALQRSEPAPNRGPRPYL